MLIEVHMLKNYPPVNLNRDENGTPKTCIFGGSQRGRISSQCLKRTWRTSELFREAVGEENLGCRTRRMPEMVCDELVHRGIRQDLAREAGRLLVNIGRKENGGGEPEQLITPQIVLYSREDIQELVNLMEVRLKTCSSVAQVRKLSVTQIREEMHRSAARAVSLDAALWGRMVTSEAFRNVEAAMQVANAVSTNRLSLESDLFTAVDDMVPTSGDEPRSAMVDSTDYNSACYYFYASLDTDQLAKNLGDGSEALVRAAVIAWIRTMSLTNPSGKQNTFAGNVLPSVVLVECKDQHVPVNLVNAYSVPVRADSRGGLVANSVERLMDACIQAQDLYGIPVTARYWFTVEDLVFPLDRAVNCRTLPELFEAVRTKLGGGE